MSLFGKKPAAPATPRTKPVPPPAPIAISGLGIACHAGDEPNNLIRSIIGQVSGVRLSEEHKFKQKDGKDALPRMAPVVEFGAMPALDRLYELTTIALSNTVAQFPANVKPESVLVVFTVAPQFIMHLLKIAPQYLQSDLVEKIPQLTSATFRILPKDHGFPFVFVQFGDGCTQCDCA